MLTQEQVLDAIKNGRESGCIDGRDFSRLADFFPVEQWDVFGFRVKDGHVAPSPKEWTKDNILEQLREDVAFGFEKALDKRGISADCMHGVVSMWMWVLNDSLQQFDLYENYGLPLFKAVATKYGFKNPIGDDTGMEAKYASD